MSTLKVNRIESTDGSLLTSYDKNTDSWNFNNITKFKYNEERYSKNIVQFKQKVYEGVTTPTTATSTTPVPFAASPPDFISINTGNTLIINISFLVLSVSAATTSPYYHDAVEHGGIIYINSTKSSAGYDNSVGNVHTNLSNVPAFNENEIVHKEVCFWGDTELTTRSLYVHTQVIDTPSINFPAYTCYVGLDDTTKDATTSFQILNEYGVKFVFMELQK
tara:strand:+ start:761 stop:1420 length:660 start_codon:yes stop_codon:yes gene_type:complete